MKNKKGITLGRILLYILFISLLGFFIYIIAYTFKAIKEKNPSITSTHDVIRQVENNSSSMPVNLLNLVDYPFQNKSDSGSSTSIRGFTGFYIWLNPGTYTLSVDSSFVSSYSYGIEGIFYPGYFQSGYTIFDSDWVTTSTKTFTLTQGYYIGIIVKKNNNGSVSTSYLNGLNWMLNVGSTAQSYVAYSNNYVNALDYVSNISFSGNYQHQFTEGLGYATGDIPCVSIFNDSVSSSHTTYSPVLYNHNDLYLGSSISSLYNSINNTSFSWTGSWFSGGSFTYNSTLANILLTCNCNVPIPINYFNFTLNGINKNSTSSAILILSCNDDITLYMSFDTSSHFDYQMILNNNPNITNIYSFGLYIYYNSSVPYPYPTSSSSLSLGSYSWSSMISSCNFHISFDNIYGDQVWQNGYDEGFRNGQASADEGLVNSNVSLQNQVDSLSSQVSDLTSRVNTQSEIIDSLNQQLQTSSNNFKGLFFTMADVPFKTVANALGFEFWGINLFKFFVGIITALGIVWLIKRIL